MEAMVLMHIIIAILMQYYYSAQTHVHRSHQDAHTHAHGDYTLGTVLLCFSCGAFLDNTPDLYSNIPDYAPEIAHPVEVSGLVS